MTFVGEGTVNLLHVIQNVSITKRTYSIYRQHHSHSPRDLSRLITCSPAYLTLFLFNTQLTAALCLQEGKHNGIKIYMEKHIYYWVVSDVITDLVVR